MQLAARPEPPLPCFGLEQDLRTELCLLCPHSGPCGEHMAQRLGRVPLNELKFDLLPDSFDVKFRDISRGERDFQATFDLCYQQAFGAHSGINVTQHARKVLTMARKSNCSPRLFILTVMVAHRQAYPDMPFKSGLLVDGRAAYRVRTYADACKKMFGGLTDQALDLATKQNLSGYEINQRMEKSEILAGQWIIDFKLRSHGKPFLPFFSECEIKLDPNWLAIEPHYLEIVKTHLKDPGKSSAQREHRHSVRKALDRLKKHRNQAIGNFRAREAIMPSAIVKVLEKFRYSAKDFEAMNAPVTDPLHFWNRLGLAVQHNECLKIINLEPSAYGPPPGHHPASVRF